MEDVIAIVLGSTALVGAIIAGIAAKSSRDQVALAKKQVQNSQRPVLVPVHGNVHVPFRGGTIHAHAPHHVENPTDRPDLPPYSALFLAVENIGAGPALDVRGEARAPRGTGQTDHSVGGIGAGQMNVVEFVSETESLGFTGNDSQVSFVISYEDVTGQSYTTTADFRIGPHAYRTRHRAR